MNADAACQALKIAQQRHGAADDESAIRFAQKALQLDNTLRDAQALIDHLKKFGPDSEMKEHVDRILQARATRADAAPGREIGCDSQYEPGLRCY